MATYFFISLWYLEAEYDIKLILTKKKNEITIGPLLKSRGFKNTDKTPRHSEACETNKQTDG